MTIRQDSPRLFLMQFLRVPQMEGARSPQGEKSNPSFIVSIRCGINICQRPSIFLKKFWSVIA